MRGGYIIHEFFNVIRFEGELIQTSEIRGESYFGRFSKVVVELYVQIAEYCLAALMVPVWYVMYVSVIFTF